MTTQPKPLRLADALDNPPGAPLFVEAAAELRRLQAENEAQAALLRQALEEIEHHGGHLPWTAFVELRHDIRQHLEGKR